MNALRIAVEGLDGCGKSTLCRHLSENYQYDVLPTPLPDLKPFRETIDACLDPSPLARVSYYTANVHRAGDRAKEYVGGNTSIVLDRYWLSTRVYGEVQAPEFPYEAHEKVLEPMDFTFFLNIPLEERKKRLKNRGNLEAHDRMTLIPEKSVEICRLYRKFGQNDINGHFVELDCSELTLDEIVHLIHEHITLEAVK